MLPPSKRFQRLTEAALRAVDGFGRQYPIEHVFGRQVVADDDSPGDRERTIDASPTLAVRQNDLPVGRLITCPLPGKDERPNDVVVPLDLADDQESGIFADVVLEAGRDDQHSCPGDAEQIGDLDDFSFVS